MQNQNDVILELIDRTDAVFYDQNVEVALTVLTLALIEGSQRLEIKKEEFLKVLSKTWDEIEEAT